MRILLQLLTDLLWPSRARTPASVASRDVWLRSLVVLIIVLLCGPEVFLAADLVALVDLLGAVLFLTAFAVGYRVLILAAVARLQRILFPPEWTALLRARNHPSIVAHGLFLTGLHAVRIAVFCAVALLGMLMAAAPTIDWMIGSA